MKVILLTELCNEIINRCHIIADRVSTPENPNKYTNFRVYIPENLRSDLNIKFGLGFLTCEDGVFHYLVLHAIKSYNMYKNWSKSEIIKHKNRIENNIDLENYPAQFSPEIIYNWYNTIFYDLRDLKEYAKKLIPPIYLNENKDSLVIPENIDLYELLFETINYELKIENDRCEIERFTNFEQMTQSLLRCFIKLNTDEEIDVCNLNFIPKAIDINRFDEYRKIVDIKGTYTFEDYLKLTYIPNPNLVKNKSNNNYGIISLDEYFSIEDDIHEQLNEELEIQNDLFKSTLKEIDFLTLEFKQKAVISEEDFINEMNSAYFDDPLLQNLYLYSKFENLQSLAKNILKIINQTKNKIDYLEKSSNNEVSLENDDNNIENIDESNLDEIDHNMLDDLESLGVSTEDDLDFKNLLINIDVSLDNVELKKFFKRDKDWVPFGKFGLEKSNPILTTSIFETTAYLKRLRTPDNKKVDFNRVGSTFSSIPGPILDMYEILQNNKTIATLYFEPHNEINSTEVPEGFILI